MNCVLCEEAKMREGEITCTQCGEWFESWKSKVIEKKRLAVDMAHGEDDEECREYLKEIAA